MRTGGNGTCSRSRSTPHASGATKLAAEDWCRPHRVARRRRGDLIMRAHLSLASCVPASFTARFNLEPITVLLGRDAWRPHSRRSRLRRHRGDRRAGAGFPQSARSQQVGSPVGRRLAVAATCQHDSRRAQPSKRHLRTRHGVACVSRARPGGRTRGASARRGRVLSPRAEDDDGWCQSRRGLPARALERDGA